MKQIKSYLALVAIAMMPLMFTSCDDDPWDWDYYDYYGDWYYDYNWYDDAFDYGDADLNAMAQMLRGHWEGTLRNEYTNEFGQREYADMYVDFEFDQYNSRSLNGRGREIDYVGDEYQELRFSWYIDPRTGNINIRYDNSGYTFVLDAHANSSTSGFSLSSDAFSGVMEGVNNTELVYFDCQRTTLAKGNTRAADDSTAVASKGKYTEHLKLRKR